MAMSGVKINSSITEEFNQLKVANKSQVKYIVMKLGKDEEGKSEVIIENIVKKDPEGGSKNYDELKQSLADFEKNGECRYVLYDWYFTTTAGSQKAKPLLLLWSPDTAGIKSKMVYASTFNALKNSLRDGYTAVEIHDLDEFSEDNLNDKVGAAK